MISESTGCIGYRRAPIKRRPSSTCDRCACGADGGFQHYPSKVVTTDQAGRFRIAGIAPGDFKLFAWSDVEPNIYFDSSFMERFDSQSKLLHMDANGTMKITLSPIPMP